MTKFGVVFGTHGDTYSDRGNSATIEISARGLSRREHKPINPWRQADRISWLQDILVVMKWGPM